MYNQDDFVNRVQKLAIDRGTNLKAITREIGISNSSFTDWKKGRGKPSIETFCKLADYFKVSLDWLAYGSQPVAKLDFPNRASDQFSSKFRQLSSELQSKVLSYMDGMLAVMDSTDSNEKRLSV